MKYEFTAEEQGFRQEVKDFLAKEWTDDSFAVEGSEEAHATEMNMRKKLANQGWLALSWPKEYGGAGATHMQQAIFTDEWSYAYAPGRDGEGIGYIGPGHNGPRHGGAEETTPWRHRPGRSRVVPGLLGA